MIEVEEVLKKKNVDFRLIELSQNAFTVDDVVNYSNGDVDPAEICKTIILRGKKSGDLKAIFVRGDDRIDFAKAKTIFGEAMEIADREGVLAAASVEPGAVCPFLLNVPLSVDKRVFSLEKINCGSGHHLYGLEFPASGLGKLQFEELEIVKQAIVDKNTEQTWFAI